MRGCEQPLRPLLCRPSRSWCRSTSVLAENGRVRRWSRRWGKGVGVVEGEWVGSLAAG